ncbi:MAG: hypothetical protein LW832_09685 [Parachlamydia sp.]|jgi:hypothetical protein|nr:hypothetical protein [Parachlamydia sp.]
MILISGNGINSGKGTALHRGTSKGQHMNLDYENIFKWHGFQKKNIYLIDDSYLNCHDAERHGFKAIRMPCNVANRPPGASYAKEKGKIFEHLHALLDTVDIKDQANDSQDV